MALTFQETFEIGQKIGAIRAGISELLPPKAEEKAKEALKVVSTAFSKDSPGKHKVTRAERRLIAIALMELLRTVWDGYCECESADEEAIETLYDQIHELGGFVVAEWKD